VNHCFKRSTSALFQAHPIVAEHGLLRDYAVSAGGRRFLMKSVLGGGHDRADHGGDQLGGRIDVTTRGR
jgi:hypothetical protein